MYDWISKNGDEVGLFFSSSETLVLFVYVRFDMKQKNDPTRSCLFFLGGGGLMPGLPKVLLGFGL